MELHKMSTLKKLFPLSFGADSVASLVIKILIYVCLPTILGIVTAIIAIVPVIGGIIAWALGVVSGLIGLYCLAGIVILVLDYLKVLKD